jgi:isoquinoline 1-oxidoreductase beta subunit
MIIDHCASRTAGLGELPRANRLSRRGFLRAGAAASGGLMLSLSLPFGKGEAEAADAFVPNAFVRIGSDGQIVLTMPYVEMGQGTYTSIPMLIAEELEVDLKQIRLEHAPPNEKLYANPLLGVQATGNSNAMRGAWQPLRQAGATAKMMLVAAAAKKWNVDTASCRHREEASNMAHLPQMPPECLSPKTSRSSDRRISGLLAPRPSVSTHQRRSTERPFTASMFGRPA